MNFCDFEAGRHLIRLNQEDVEQASYLYRDGWPCLAGLGRWTGAIANAPPSAASLLTRLASKGTQQLVCKPQSATGQNPQSMDRMPNWYMEMSEPSRVGTFSRPQTGPVFASDTCHYRVPDPWHVFFFFIHPDACFPTSASCPGHSLVEPRCLCMIILPLFSLNSRSPPPWACPWPLHYFLFGTFEVILPPCGGCACMSRRFVL